MRILIIGQNYSAEKFFKYFQDDKNNIVFSTMNYLDNYVNFINSSDIKEFSLANQINLVLILDEEYINEGLQEELSAYNITAFSPSIEAIGIVVSKASAKKFMHRKKITTPKFLIAEKPQMAFEYLKSAKKPQAIKPDNHNYRECTQFVETFNKAQEIVNRFFETGNKKIIIEDYIEGKNIKIFVISDGYKAKILMTCAIYQNNIAYFEPEFVSQELKEKITNEIISPIIEELSNQDEEYVGILGFDFILNRNNVPYLLGFNGFFDDMTVDFALNGFDIEWASLFDSCIVGDVLMKYDFISNNKYMMTFRNNNEINFIEASTKSNLEKYISELGLDNSEYKEALALWKY